MALPAALTRREAATGWPSSRSLRLSEIPLASMSAGFGSAGCHPRIVRELQTIVSNLRTGRRLALLSNCRSS
jgi:hypothetical protein